MARYLENDGIRLRVPVRAHTWEGEAHDLQAGTEGVVIICSDDHPGRQVVEFDLAVLDKDGRPEDIPIHVEAELLDDQMELVYRP